MEKQALAFAMTAHPRLGSSIAVPLPHEIMAFVMSMVEITVPDTVPSVRHAMALRRTRPSPLPLRVLMRKGECDFKEGEDGAPSEDPRVPVRGKNVLVRGEPGAVLRGMLVMLPGSSGRFENIRFEDSGDSCVLVRGGEWEFVNCVFCCGHAQSVRVEGRGAVALTSCSIGGEGPVGQVVSVSAYGSVQQMNLTRHACYGLFAVGSASVIVSECSLRYCSEAAVFMNHAATVTLNNCTVAHCKAAFLCGEHRGRSFEMVDGDVACVRSVWADHDRPLEVVWNRTDTSAGYCSGCAFEYGHEAYNAHEVVPLGLHHTL